MIEIHWIPLREARAFVRRYHRHARSCTGAIVALGAWEGDELLGVVLLARPNARMSAARQVEIIRVCTQGRRNLCSKLYAKAKRLGQAMGFLKTKTFTLLEESGASLRAVGAVVDRITEGGLWERDGRPRSGENEGIKKRWAL